MSVLKHCVFLGSFLCLSLFSHAGEVDAFKGVSHDPKIPTMKDVAGFDFGHKIAMHHEILAYARALAAASPKVSLVLRGKTWEDREMGLLFVTSEANQARLEEFKTGYQALSDPRKTDDAAMKELVGKLPVMTLLQESVHGNEISGADSGMLLAWHLASATGNKEIDDMLESGVLAIELMQNPDGRDRFITYSRHARSPGGNPDPQAAERAEDWPSGRFNHYNFDMNRDWFAMSQPETQTKVASFLEWFPQVTVDLHEMGSESSFFAAKPAPPANPILPKSSLDGYEKLGRAIGEAFDARGYDYFHSEVFDSFYPGYGEAWPSLHGALGVLFEQGSARGLRYQRKTGEILTHRDAVDHQAVGSYAVFQFAVNHRSEILEGFYNYRKEAMGLPDNKYVFLLPGNDPLRSLNLGRLLVRQGIEVAQINETVKGVQLRKTPDGEANKTDLPAGSLVVDLSQPAGRLARSLLWDQLDMDPEFIKAQDERRKKRQGLEIYDVTGWSLPYAFGAPAAFGSNFKGSGSNELKANVTTRNMDASVGYLIPNTINNGALLSYLLGEDVAVSFNTEPIKQDGVSFPRGSLLIKVKRNPENLQDILTQASERFEVSVFGVNTSWFEEGPGFGSDLVRYIKPPRVAMLWNVPTNPMSAGWMRYILEQRLGYSVTALKTTNVGRYSLSKYDVIVMPEGYGWDRVLGPGGKDNLIQWVRNGGTLITLAASTEWLIDEDVELLSTVKEMRGGVVPEKKEETEHPKVLEKDPFDMVIPKRESPEQANGVLMRAVFDTEHWLAYGMNSEQAVMVDSNRIMRPLRLDSGSNVARYAAADKLLLSGYISDENLAQFAHKPFLMETSVGSGRVIAFTEDPNYRAFMEGMLPLINNAVFFSGAMSYR